MTGEKTALIAGMVSARRRESDRKQAASASTINSFLLNGTLINISAVAAAAGVSRNFIYTNESLLNQLEAARQTQADANTPRQRRPTHGAPGRTALQSELTLAHQNIKRLQQELTDIKRRHECCLGEQIGSSEQVEERESAAPNSLEIERLRQENSVLTQEVETLSHRIDDLIDDLTAERRGLS